MARAFGKALPSNRRKSTKTCIVCGEKIMWHRRLAGDWGSIRYCSASCRRVSVAQGRELLNRSVEMRGPESEAA